MRTPVAARPSWRVASRAAGTLWLAATAATRLRGLGPCPGSRERSLVLRDGARKALALHGLEVVVEGSPPEGAALLASNHVSWLDPLVVATAVPCVPISKADVAAWPVVGRLASGMGVIFLSRGDTRSGARVIREADGAFRQGLPVLNFPEGTTTDGSTVKTFRRGLFGIAGRAGVPVVPVAIAYEPRGLAWVGDQAFFPHWLALAASAGGRAFLRFGRALSAPEAEPPEALAGVARARILDMLGGPRVAAVGA